MLQFRRVQKVTKRPYKPPVGERQAGDPRRRIVEATRQLLRSEGYAGMTIEAIARRAEGSPQSVYGIFKSKTGILTGLLDQSTFGPGYEQLIRQSLIVSVSGTRSRFAGHI